MRVLARERAAEIAKQEEAVRRFETTVKEEVVKKLAAGFSKREVVQWARENGVVSSALSHAVGIPLRDIQDGKY